MRKRSISLSAFVNQFFGADLILGVIVVGLILLDASMKCSNIEAVKKRIAFGKIA